MTPIIRAMFVPPPELVFKIGVTGGVPGEGEEGPPGDGCDGPGAILSVIALTLN